MHPTRKIHRTTAATIICLCFTLLPQAAVGDQRAFTYTYEATTLPKGALELENWVTWKTDKGSDASFDRYDFRHELEYGVTDNFQVALYLSDWRYEKSKEDETTEWRNVAVEAIYNISDPTADLLGSGLYGEVKLGDELFSLESKLLLQKNIDRVILAYNASIEAEWEGPDYEEDKGEFQQTVGVSYQFVPKFSGGFEFLHEVEFEDWETTGDNLLYLGPVASYRGQDWFATLTTLVQLTDVSSEVDLQTRLIVGIDLW